MSVAAVVLRSGAAAAAVVGVAGLARVERRDLVAGEGVDVMGTLERPSSGRVTEAGADVDDLDDRELAGLRATAIGFVFQQLFLIEGMSALDNVPTACSTATQRRGRHVDLS
jgi:predicted ABC-type transport system involved in lysophospholipase L1 biosynthesis ATPase subunit